MSVQAKKFFVSGVLALALVLSVGLVGCGGGEAPAEGDSASEIMGTWSLSGIEVDGVEMPEEYVEQYLSVLGEDTLKISFKDNGEAQLDFAGVSEGGATYTYENGKGAIENEGETLDFTFSDGKIKAESEGIVLVFSK